MNVDDVKCVNALIDGINIIKTTEAIESKKRMYRSGGDIYKILLMIVAFYGVIYVIGHYFKNSLYRMEEKIAFVSISTH